MAGNIYLLGGLFGALPPGRGVDQTQVTAQGVVTFAIENSVQASEMLQNPSVEATFDRIEWSTLPFNFCQVNLDYQTPRSTSFSLAQNVSQPLTSTSLRSEITGGLNATSRAITPRISNVPQASSPGATVNLNALAFAQVKIRGYQVDMNPGSP